MSGIVDPGSWPTTLPELHRDFLAGALEILGDDARLVGVAVGGSFISDALDDHSDLDLVIAVEPPAWPEILDDRKALAARLGPLLEAFTGEHVSEPRLLVCLYGPPLLHVDLKFVSLDDVAQRVEDPVILWERDGRLSDQLATESAHYPQPELDWLEERFWVWCHYTSGKIERGELFEAINALAYYRFKVLGPLALQAAGARPDGLRRFETEVSELVEQMRRCVGGYDAASLTEALLAIVELYRQLRHARDPERSARPSEAEREVTAHLAGFAERLRRAPQSDTEEDA